MPVITKRKITPPAPAVNTSSVPQLTVETSAPSAPVSTNTEVGCSDCYYDDFDIPYFYNPLIPLLHLLWMAFLIIMAIVAVVVILNIVFFSLMGLIVFLLPKSQRCKNCGRIYRINRADNNRCPYCGALQNEDIQGH